MESEKNSEALAKDYCWRSALKSAISKNRRDAHNRYLQLATVRPDGSPAVRSLVFRGFDADSATLAMITDLRSQKVAEIATRAKGEVCWYFTHTREQFRLAGTLTLTGEGDEDQHARQALWSSLSDAARSQFYWPAPRLPLDDETPVDERGLTFKVENPPAVFLALHLGVLAVDHLRLRGQPQSRWISKLDASENWVNEPVNP